MLFCGLDCDFKGKFGTTGKSDGQFMDPAGLVSVSIGNVILADAGNHSLQVFDKSQKFVGNVHIYKGLRRPHSWA